MHFSRGSSFFFVKPEEFLKKSMFGTTRGLFVCAALVLCLCSLTQKDSRATSHYEVFGVSGAWWVYVFGRNTKETAKLRPPLDPLFGPVCGAMRTPREQSKRWIHWANRDFFKKHLKTHGQLYPVQCSWFRNHPKHALEIMWIFPILNIHSLS